MKKILKVLWILAVHSIHLSPCYGSDDGDKKFNYEFNLDTGAKRFPRNYTVMSDTELIAIKCPNEGTIPYSNNSDTGVIIYKRPADSVKESLSFNIKGNQSRDHWRIYNIGKLEEIKINCLNVYKNNESNFLARWDHIIKRTNGTKSNIIKGKHLNITSHSHNIKVHNASMGGRTIAFGEELGYREFNSEHPQIYKGDKLVTFLSTDINSEDIEFLEPIGITQVYHLPPYINIQINPNLTINSENKEWWLVEPNNFPCIFNITLACNGTTSQPGFFGYQNITVSYLKYSKDNKLEEIKKEVLKSNGTNETEIFIGEPVIVKFNYYCDNCIDGGIDVIQNVLIGKNFDFKNKTLPPIEYAYGRLNFNANCSLNLNSLAHLKTLFFYDEKIRVQVLQRTNDILNGNFKLDNGLVIFKNKHANGTLHCTYIYPFGEFHTSQIYKPFKDKQMPPITYLHGQLFFQPNCSMDQFNSANLKTILFNEEGIEIEDLQRASGRKNGSFKIEGNFVIFSGTDLNGKLSCIHKLPYGEISKYQIYRSFKDKQMPSVTYFRGELFFKPNCSMKQGDSVNLKTFLFNDELVEIDGLQNARDTIKVNFKLDENYVIFMDNNPKTNLSCTYKLTYGEYTVNQTYKYYKTTSLPVIRYAFNQLSIRPNCSVEPESNVIIKTILFNNESIEVKDLEKATNKSKGNFKLDGKFVFFMGNNPNGKCTCVYKLHVGEIKTFQGYESIQNTILPIVRYTYDQLNSFPNCSIKVNNFTHFKAIKFNNEKIEVENLDTGALNREKNIKSEGNFLTYTIENPKGKFACIYKVTFGEIEISQNYEPILNKTLPVVEYSLNELGYKANCTVNLNNYTKLRYIIFKDDEIELGVLELVSDQEFGRLKLEKEFVINKEKNPNGTLFCRYDVPIGEFLLIKKFQILKINNGQTSTNKIGVIINMILEIVIVINMIILII